VVSSATYPTQAAYQTTYSYDSTGEQVSTITPATAAAPSGATTTFTYDPVGNVLTRTGPDNVKTTWTYTPLNNVATVSYSGSSAHSVSDTYDADGNETGMTDASGSSSYVYDPFGELTSASNGASQTTGYAYTADSLPTSATLGSTGDTITTTYDPTDTASVITLKNASSTLQSFTYTDSPGRTILNEADIPASPNSPAVYTYDAKSRVTSMTPGSGSTLSYGFDASGDLTTLPNGASGTYDKAGEPTTSALAGTTTNYSYNAVGERLTATQGSTTVASGTWNGAAQLTTYSDSAANMTAATYDGNGHRTSTTITPSGQSATTQGYVWNGNSLLMDGTNAYIYAAAGVPAEQVSLANGTLTYLVTDPLQSVRGTVNASGILTGSTSYDAWGNPLTTGGLTATTPFGYAGGYTDPDGLLYLINRYYDPATGQFTSVDPDLAQTLQPYAYTDGDPVNQSDPTGQAASHPNMASWALDTVYGEHILVWGKAASGKFSYDYVNGQTSPPTDAPDQQSYCHLHVDNLRVLGAGFIFSVNQSCYGNYGQFQQVWGQQLRSSWSGWRGYGHDQFSGLKRKSFTYTWVHRLCSTTHGWYNYAAVGDGFAVAFGWSGKLVTATLYHKDCGPGPPAGTPGA
jgi:RHS repeat-associated protein